MPSRVKPITAGSLPSPSLRVGITGARDLPQDQLSRIQFQLDKVIALTRVCAEEALASHATNSHSTKEPAIRMRFLSPLALGADRIAAVAALQHKYELCVPMPFPVNEYEQDFRTSSSVRNEGGRQETNLEEFRRLKKQAKERIELDGSREGNMTSLSYLAVGRYVVHHSDLLIAVWDGSLGNGTGGTADIVRLASNSSIPICWIHSTKERDPVLIEDLQGLRSALAGDMNFKPAWQGISRYVKSALTAAKTATPPSHRSASKSRSWLVRSDKKDFLLEFLSESLPMPRPRIWNAHKLLMMWAAGGHAGRKPDLVPSDAIGRYWHGHYECGDRLANEYAARYRSTYTWIILLTTLTLCFAAVSCGLQALNITDLEWLSRVVAILELVSLFIIVGLVVGSRRLGWHRKSVEYRLMAELCRKQRMLGTLGWSLPLENVQLVADGQQMSWISWLFAAIARQAPLQNTPPISPLENKERIRELVEDQIEYHRNREHESHSAQARLEKLASLAFLGVTVAVLLKLFLELMHTDLTFVVVLSMLAIVLPAVSAAFFALRSYAELELLAEQSNYMIHKLKSAARRIEALKPERVLVSQELGHDAATIAGWMLQDLEGWGRLFRGKLPEA